MIKTRFIAAALLTLGVAATAGAMPAQAGPAETQMLQKYAGVWNGRGTIEGAENGTAVCKLTFKPNGEKLNYSGRCSLAGNSTSFKGTMVYDQRSDRFVMSTSGAGQSQTVAGRRNGGSIVFVTGGDDRRGSYTSTMTLSNSIQMNFAFQDAKTNEKTTAKVGFSKG